MIFIDNRYTAIYFKIVNRALLNSSVSTTDVERHHIIPESFFKNRVRLGPNGWLEGSSEDSSNIVYLTLREHAFCHKLLVKMTTGKMKSKMVLAIWRMLNGKHNKLFSSRDYETYRRLFTECLKEVTEHKKRKPLTKSHKENISIAIRGKPKTEKTKNKMKQAWKKRDKTVKDSTKELNRIASKKFWSSMKAREIQSKKKKDFLESNPLFLETQIKNLNKSITCEYCFITTNIGNYKRWHGQKCKLNKT